MRNSNVKHCAFSSLERRRKSPFPTRNKDHIHQCRIPREIKRRKRWKTAWRRQRRTHRWRKTSAKFERWCCRSQNTRVESVRTPGEEEWQERRRQRGSGAQEEVKAVGWVTRRDRFSPLSPVSTWLQLEVLRHLQPYL